MNGATPALPTDFVPSSIIPVAKPPQPQVANAGGYNVLDDIRARYPVFSPHLGNVIVQKGEAQDDERQLEFYPPWESQNPNPGKITVETYRDFKGKEMGDMVAGDLMHYLGAVNPNTNQPIDPQFRAMKQAVLSARTYKNDQTDRQAYQEEKDKGITTENYQDWLDHSRVDAYIRGYITPDTVDEWRHQGVYNNPNLQQAVQNIKNYVTGRDERQEIYKAINQASQKTGLPGSLIYSMMKQESRFNPAAVSMVKGKPGAMGLMQLMPDTAKQMGIENPFDIEENVLGGARYMKKLLDARKGNIPLALASYDAGPNNVGNRVPRIAETQQYVSNIMRDYQKGVTMPSDADNQNQNQQDGPTDFDPSSIRPVQGGETAPAGQTPGQMAGQTGVPGFQHETFMGDVGSLATGFAKKAGQQLVNRFGQMPITVPGVGMVGGMSPEEQRQASQRLEPSGAGETLGGWGESVAEFALLDKGLKSLGFLDKVKQIQQLHDLYTNAGPTLRYAIDHLLSLSRKMATGATVGAVQAEPGEVAKGAETGAELGAGEEALEMAGAPVLKGAKKVMGALRGPSKTPVAQTAEPALQDTIKGHFDSLADAFGISKPPADAAMRDRAGYMAKAMKEEAKQKFKPLDDLTDGQYTKLQDQLQKDDIAIQDAPTFKEKQELKKIKDDHQEEMDVLTQFVKDKGVDPDLARQGREWWRYTGGMKDLNKTMQDVMPGSASEEINVKKIVDRLQRLHDSTYDTTRGTLVRAVPGEQSRLTDAMAGDKNWADAILKDAKHFLEKESEESEAEKERLAKVKKSGEFRGKLGKAAAIGAAGTIGSAGAAGTLYELYKAGK